MILLTWVTNDRATQGRFANPGMNLEGHVQSNFISHTYYMYKYHGFLTMPNDACAFAQTWYDNGGEQDVELGGKHN